MCLKRSLNVIKIWQHFGFIYHCSTVIYSNNYDARCHPLFNHQNKLHAFVPPVQLRRCQARRAFLFITDAIWGTRQIPLWERSQDRNWQYCSSITVGGKKKKEQQREKQTKALALRSCSGDDNNKKGGVINAVLDSDNTLLMPETNDGNS